VLPFSRIEEGDVLAEAVIAVRSAVEAKAIAARMEGPERGAVAFSRTGDPQLGERADAVILGRYGDVPDDLPYTSGYWPSLLRNQRFSKRKPRARLEA
jgi:hypothetical protein